VLSFDSSFTGRDLSVLGGFVAPEDKQTVLNVYDSHSGCVFAIPVPLRRDVHFMCWELMIFLKFLERIRDPGSNAWVENAVNRSGDKQ